MKNSSGIKSRIRIALLALMAVAVLVFWAAGIVMLSRTFVVWWVPVAISLAVSVMLLPLLLRFLRAVIPVGNDIVNVMIHLAAVGGLLFFLFLGLNTWIPRTDSIHDEEFEVTDKYSRRHTRYRRVGRHRHLADGYRWSYGIELRRSGGDGTETIGQQVSAGEYRRTRVGTTRRLRVYTGLFGYEVVEYR